MSILTTADLESQFNIKMNDKTVLQSMLATAEEACLSYAGITSGTVEEFFDGGCDSLAVTYGPVRGIKAVEVDGHPVVFRYDSRAHKVVLLDRAHEGRDVVKVTIECGWEEGEAPEALKSAVALTVQTLLKLTNGKLVGTLSRTTDGGSEQIEQAIPPIAVKSLLDHYRGLVM